MRPEGVVESDESVKRFYSILQSTYSEITAELNQADLSNPSRRRTQQKQIEQIIARADQNIRDWISIEVPSQYEQGMFDTLSDLNRRGDEVNIKTSFATFHEQAIQAIAEDMYANASEGLSGVSRSVSRVVSASARESVLEQIAKGSIKGDSLQKLKKSVAGILESEGLSAITDKRGRSWDLLRYAEMLSRTKLTQAHNSGVANRMVESGYDLVIVSNHSGSCRLCAPFEGKVLSVSGRQRGYISVKEAERNGLFHPNCCHVFSPYHQTFLDQAVGWDAELQKYRPFRDLQKDIIARNVDLLKAFAKNAKWGEMMADSVVGNAFEVKMADSKRERVVAINGFEQQVMEKRGLKIDAFSHRTRAGQYTPTYNEMKINLAELERAEKRFDKTRADKTFFHEFGHFLDYQFNDGIKTDSGRVIPRRLINGEEARKAISEAREFIVRERASATIDSLAKDGTKFEADQSREQLVDRLVLGDKIKTDDGKSYIAFSAHHRKYLRQNEEVFAEAYAIYRTDPNRLKENASKLFDLFEKLKGQQ